MPTNFPTSVDNFTNPTANDSLNLPSHSTQHANANDAIEAIEDYLLNGGQGLTLVKKQDVGTAVSSIVVNNAFSATYDNYKIIISGGTATVLDSFSLALNGLVSNYRHQFIFGTYSSTLTGNGSIGNAAWPYVGFHSTNYLDMNVDLRNPFTAKITTMVAAGISGSTYAGTNVGLQADSTSATGFTVSMGAAGTMTGGTVYVYGYRKS